MQATLKGGPRDGHTIDPDPLCNRHVIPELGSILLVLNDDDQVWPYWRYHREHRYERSTDTEFTYAGAGPWWRTMDRGIGIVTEPATPQECAKLDARPPWEQQSA